MGEPIVDFTVNPDGTRSCHACGARSGEHETQCWAPGCRRPFRRGGQIEEKLKQRGVHDDH